MFAQVKEVFFNGVKKVYEIKTEDGLCLKSTEHHKYLTKKGFVQLSELKIGDYIARNGI